MRLALYFIHLVKLRYPIGQHIHHFIRLGRVVGDEMYAEIMRSVHAFMHHENAGFNDRAFARLENHRTDG